MSKKRERRSPKPRRYLLSAEDLIDRAAFKVVTVTRKAAITRLLDTSIWLWVHEKDPLSTHVLILAAYNCLESLGRKDGKGPILKAQLKDEHFTIAYDFLRHASSNPNDGLDFPALANGPILFDAINSYGQIFESMSILMMTFRAYFMSGNVFELPEEASGKAAQFFPEGLTQDATINWGKLDFFKNVSEMFARQHGIKISISI